MIEVALAVLAGLVVFQQVYFLRQIQKLVDKLMSRSFTEYQTAQKPREKPVRIDDGVPDDLRILQEFTL